MLVLPGEDGLPAVATWASHRVCDAVLRQGYGRQPSCSLGSAKAGAA